MSPLDRLVREARSHLDVTEPIDWSRVEAGLFSRVEQERRAERRRFIPSRGRAWVVTGAAAVAAAAALTVALGYRGEAEPLDDRRDRAQAVALSVIRVEAPGQLLVDGAVVSRGAAVRVGDFVEARNGQVLLEQAGRLRVIVEKGTRVRVDDSSRTLVLALEQGAVEADVVPVASGEALAIDVAASRVAVHGTHLRVARMANQVAVDLSEGVVAVGEAPRTGPLLGSLVVAPAHAEFAASDPIGTLTVTHDWNDVRTAAAFGSADPPSAASNALSAASSDSLPVGRPDLLLPGRLATPLVPTRAPAAASGSSAAVTPALANAEQVIAHAVQACMAERPRADNVTVLVSTTLHIDVADDGAVRSARFDPPVMPDVNECASRSIYRVRFTHTGPIAISIDFKN